MKISGVEAIQARNILVQNRQISVRVNIRSYRDAAVPHQLFCNIDRNTRSLQVCTEGMAKAIRR